MKRMRQESKRKHAVIEGTMRASGTARRLLIGTAVLAAPFSTAQAQEVAAAPATDTGSLAPRSENGRQVYETSQFTRFAPQTALDIVRYIPGFSITQVSGDRGLGEATQNVLINGQRVTGKSNDAETALSRIAVSSIIRLEIADGATWNVTGLSGQVLNVVTKADSLQGNFTWKPQFRKRIEPTWYVGEVNLSGQLGKGSFTLGLNNNNGFRGGGWGEEIVRDAAGNLLFVRDQFGTSSGDRPKLTATYSLKSSNGNILNANAAGELFRFRNLRTFDRIELGQPDIFEERRGSEDEWNMELGADYEFGLGKGRLKLIGFHRFEHSAFENQFRRDFTDGTVSAGQRFDQIIDEGESVVRAEYRWKAGKTDWQVSLEGAYNFLDAQSEFFTLDAGGGYQQVPLPDATARVVEKRAQAILSYGRPLTTSLTFQATAGGEFSKLSQSGPNGLSRQFVRPKGSVSLSWKASPQFSLSAKFQRKVLQLNFGDFLSSVDVQNNNNNGSNAQLVPPQSWLFEMEANRSLGKSGSIKFLLAAESISDIVEQIPLSATEEAPGNLPSSAKRLRGEINTSFLLDSLGFKGAKIDTVLALQTASLRDPLTGEKRPISSRGRSYWNLDFRHDVPGTKWAWGFFAEDSSDYGFYRLDYFVRDFRTKPFTSIYIEHKDVFGLKVKGSLFNPIGQQEKYREVFWTDRRDGPIAFTHDGTNNYGLIFRLVVSGTF
jgi:outer membrane receptor for ferrienterochelin and colicins